MQQKMNNFEYNKKCIQYLLDVVGVVVEAAIVVEAGRYTKDFYDHNIGVLSAFDIMSCIQAI